MDPKVAVLKRTQPGLKNVRDLPEWDQLEALPLSEALAREWAWDAHLLMYRGVDESGLEAYLRINKRSPAPQQLLEAGCRIETTVLVFDYDLPKVEDKKRAWLNETEVEQFLLKLGEAAIPEPTYFYTTRNGARFVYVLDRPVPVAESEGLMAGIIRDFKAAGIELDESCKDWTRCFRLPRVIREDTGKKQHTDPCFVFLDGGPTLDPDRIEPGEIGATETYAEVEEFEGDIPTPEECHEILWEASDKGWDKPTAWHRTAKHWLTGRDSWDIIWGKQPIDESRGRNNQITRLIGQAVGLLHHRDGATPQGIYALFLEAVDQLQPDGETPSWNRATWDIVQRLWNAEAQQHAAREQHEAAQEGADEDAFKVIVASLRTQHPNITELHVEGETSEACARGRLIAAGPKGLYVMQRDGTYSPYACTKDLLHAEIRQLKMGGVIETHELVGKAWKSRSAQSILDTHAISVHRLEASPSARFTHIRELGDLRTLVFQVHKLRPDLSPKFSPEVDAWLRAFAGFEYDDVVEWLSHCLDVGRPICALNLIGASGAGKNMLVQGVAECFLNPDFNDHRALGRFNVGLMDNPVVHLEEGIPDFGALEGTTTDQRFRAAVSGGNYSIEPKGKDVIHAHIYPRIILSSNNSDVMAAICGRRDLSPQDIRAIEQRLLTVAVKESGQLHLTALGNYQHTRGWIQGDAPSKYVLARHIGWLFAHRKPARGEGRLLVEGRLGTAMMRNMSLRTPAALALLRTCCSMIEQNQTPEGMVFRKGRVFVTVSPVLTWYERNFQVMMNTRLNVKTAGRVLRLLCTSDESNGEVRNIPGVSGSQRTRWYELDLEILLYEAISAGFKREKIEALYAEQFGQQSLETLLENEMLSNEEDLIHE